MNKFFIFLFISHFALFKAAMSPKNFIKWPNKDIWYHISDDLFSEKEGHIFHYALVELMNVSCVRFLRAYDTSFSREYGIPLRIIDANGCFSNVGKKTFLQTLKLGYQEISLSRRCRTEPTIKHVFMHLLGLEHEQSRADRDDFITVYNERITNIEDYKIKEGDTYGPFDFQSIMLSEPWEITNTPGKPIYIPKLNKPGHDEIMFPATISWQDAKAINQIYQCGKSCNKKCHSNAYLNEKCECITPDIFAKQQCYDKRPDCKLRLQDCRIDQQLTSECRKTCKACYKSPNGVGERGDKIKCCDDIDWFCKTFIGKEMFAVNMICKKEDGKYYCPKSCRSRCRYNKVPNLINRCQNFIPQCFQQDCYDPLKKSLCAKYCQQCN